MMLQHHYNRQVTIASSNYVLWLIVTFFLILQSTTLVFCVDVYTVGDTSPNNLNYFSLASQNDGNKNSTNGNVPVPASAPATSYKLSLDVTNLGTGRSFYDRSYLELQIGNNDQIKTFYKKLGNSRINQHFVGESTTGDSLQLLRYISPLVPRQEILVGSLVDLESKQIYQFRQFLATAIPNEVQQSEDISSSNRIYVSAIVTPSDDFPVVGDAMTLDDETSAKLHETYQREDELYFQQEQEQKMKADALPQEQGEEGSEIEELSSPFDGIDVYNTRNYTQQYIIDTDTYTTNKDITVIDIMMLWSEWAECKASNLTYGCTLNTTTEDNIRALIVSDIAETNSAFTLSDIPIQLRLVHLYRHPTYDETEAYDGLGGNRFSYTLRALAIPFDFVLDDVPKKRREYKADMVSMVIADTTFCGMAFIGTGYFPYPTSPFMYSVNNVGCLGGTYVVAHELGHNFGCSHDRGTNNQCDFWWFYPAHGWRDPQGEFRTIMSYRCTTGQCDDNPGGECPAIPRFSDATATYNGKALGDWRNDCTKHIKAFAPGIAKFYDEELRYKECDKSDTLCQIGEIYDSVFDVLCFAPHMKVQVLQNNGHQVDTVTVKDLRIGDQVLTRKASHDDQTTSSSVEEDSYQTIYSINHFHKSKPTEFLQLIIESVTEEMQTTLELSKTHMLFVRGKDQPIPANEIHVGDYVQIMSSDNKDDGILPGNSNITTRSSKISHSARYALVLEVNKVVRRGFYNPLTTDGTIVVNGIVTSAYASVTSILVQSNQSVEDNQSIISIKEGFLHLGTWKVISEQRFFHALLSPYRAVSMLNLYFRDNTASENNNNNNNNNDDDDVEEYLSGYCNIGVHILRWWEQQHDWLRVVVFFSMLFVFGSVDMILKILEGLYNHISNDVATWIILATTTATLICAQHFFYSRNMKKKI